MRYNLDSGFSLKKVLFSAAAVLLVIYALYQARFIILGPYIKITAPQNGATLESNIVTIEGVVKNAAWIRLNERQIFVDEEGNFSEKLMAPDGPSTHVLSAQDRFGRVEQEKLEIFVK